jgi:predicted ATPase
MAQGYAAPEVEEVYTRARALCQQVEEPPQLFPVLIGLWRFAILRADFQVARELGEQCANLAQRVPDPAFALMVHMMWGATWLFLSEFVQARAELEQVIALCDPWQHRALVFLYGDNPGVNSPAFLAWVLWCLGYPDQAAASSRHSVSLAQELSNPISLVSTQLWAAMIHQLRREAPIVQKLVEEVLVLGTEHVFRYWLTTGTILHGWVLTEQGQKEDRDCTDTSGTRCSSNYGLRSLAPLLSCLAGREVWKGRATRGRIKSAG